MQQEDERQNEYDDVFVARLELIWGEGFLSPGGAEEVHAIVEGVPLEDREVLDIGCGTGGVDVLLVTNHGAKRVLGLDVEQPLLDRAMARARAMGVSDRLEFKLIKPGPLALADASFDVVFSKDAILHVPDKPALFSDICRILRPGGMFVASDWLKSSEPHTPALDAYREAAEYTSRMATPDSTERLLESAGFVNVVLKDRTNWLRADSLKTHERIVGPLKDQAIALIGQPRYDRWQRISQTLCAALEARELRPIHLAAQKPPAET